MLLRVAEAFQAAADTAAATQAVHKTTTAATQALQAIDQPTTATTSTLQPVHQATTATTQAVQAIAQGSASSQQEQVDQEPIAPSQATHGELASAGVTHAGREKKRKTESVGNARGQKTNWVQTQRSLEAMCRTEGIAIPAFPEHDKNKRSSMKSLFYTLLRHEADSKKAIVITWGSGKESFFGIVRIMVPAAHVDRFRNCPHFPFPQCLPPGTVRKTKDKNWRTAGFLWDELPDGSMTTTYSQELRDDQNRQQSSKKKAGDSLSQGPPKRRRRYNYKSPNSQSVASPQSTGSSESAGSPQSVFSPESPASPQSTASLQLPASVQQGPIAPLHVEQTVVLPSPVQQGQSVPPRVEQTVVLPSPMQQGPRVPLPVHQSVLQSPPVHQSVLPSPPVQQPVVPPPVQPELGALIASAVVHSKEKASHPNPESSMINLEVLASNLMPFILKNLREQGWRGPQDP